MTNELTLENIRTGAFPSDAHAVGFLLGEIEQLQKQIEILQRANRFLSEQIPHAPEPSEQRSGEFIEYPKPPYEFRGDSGKIECPMCAGDGSVYPPDEGASRDLTASESASFHKTLARSPRRIGAGIPPDGAPSMPEGASRDDASSGQLPANCPIRVTYAGGSARCTREAGHSGSCLF